MATFKVLPRFQRDFDKLTSDQRARFTTVVKNEFVPDADKGVFRFRLRVKRVQSTRDVWEMTWAPDGRATWQYGDKVRPGVPHVVWRRIGSHEIFSSP